MHKSKDYLLESSKSKLDSYRLMYFISHGRLMKLENIRDLVSKTKTIILGYIVRLFPRILMEENLGYPLKPDEDIHHHYQVHEQNRRDSIAECELNGESFPNGNAVPINNRKVIECVETVHSLS